MKIFALSGFKFSGKDTVADYLVKNYGMMKHSFAGPLKDMVSETYKFHRTYLDDPTKKETPLTQYPVDPKDEFSMMISGFMFKEFRERNGNVPEDRTKLHKKELFWTPRALAILEGSVKRSVNSKHWVSSVIDKIAFSKDKIHVISDMRYKSEMSQLKAYFGSALVTVRIDRFDTVDSKDPSEFDLASTKHNIILNNRGTIGDLYKNIDLMLDRRNIKGPLNV